MGIFPNCTQQQPCTRKADGTYNNGYSYLLTEAKNSNKWMENRKDAFKRVTKPSSQLWNQWETMEGGTYVPFESPDIVHRKSKIAPKNYNLWRDDWTVPNPNAKPTAEKAIIADPSLLWRNPNVPIYVQFEPQPAWKDLKSEYDTPQKKPQKTRGGGKSTMSTPKDTKKGGGGSAKLPVAPKGAVLPRN
jgi:hypothetical protein